MNGRFVYLVITTAAFLCLTFSFSINLWFSISGFYLVVTTIILLFFAIFHKENGAKIIKLDFRTILFSTLFLFSIISFAVNVEDVNGFLSLAMWVNRFAMFLAPFVILLYFFDKFNNNLIEFIRAQKYIILIILSLVIQLTLIRIVRVPDIDVYQVLRYGPTRILTLSNPYETGATNQLLEGNDFGYHHYAYGPATIFLFLPFDFFLKEPRYLLIIANFLAAFALYKISKIYWQNDALSQAISLIYLFSPRLVYFLTFSWTDGLIVSLLLGGMYFFLSKKFTISGILLSLTMGIKIFYGLPFLFFLKNRDFLNKKLIVAGVLTFLILHSPFLTLDWKAIYKSIVSINVGGGTFAQLQRYTLTLATFLDRQFHYYPPQFVFPVLVIFAALILWIVIRPTFDLSKTLAIVGLIFIFSVFLGPIANSSYYFTASQILLLSIATAGNKKLLYD